jgi:O-methyltransferase
MQFLMNLSKTLIRKLGLINKFYSIANSLYSPFNCLNPFNLLAIVKSFQKAKEEDIGGDYYEFGVYAGFSLWFAYQMGKEYFLDNGKAMNFWGFDSFEGLPEPKGVDRAPDSFGNYFSRGNFSASLNLVIANLKKNKVDMDKVTLIQGFYEDTLNEKLFDKYNFGKASIILIDCDLYSSTVIVLNFIKRILKLGTVILFDDYYITPSNAGQQLAIKEWLDSNKNIHLEDFCEYGDLKGFVVSKI